mgnify:CR=1 FL=1
MFTDKPENIEFLADSSIIDQIVDWFGENARIQPNGDQLKVSVKDSPMAMEYWAMQYLNFVEILTPVSLRECIKANLERATKKISLMRRIVKTRISKYLDKFTCMMQNKFEKEIFLWI